MIAVDPHQASNTAAVLDPVAKTVIESVGFASSQEGYRQWAGFAARWDGRRWAVEGCYGAGRSLAWRLVAGGGPVLEVPAKLAARVRVYSRGHGRKTGKDDAVWIGLAALDGTGVTPVTGDGALVSVRLWCDRRDELTAQRTPAVCRLHRLLAGLTPGGMRREWTANTAPALPAGDPPRGRGRPGPGAHRPRPPGRYRCPRCPAEVPCRPDRCLGHHVGNDADLAVRGRAGDRRADPRRDRGGGPGRGQGQVPPATTAPRRSAPPPVSRRGTGCRGLGTGGTATRRT